MRRVWSLIVLAACLVVRNADADDVSACVNDDVVCQEVALERGPREGAEEKLAALRKKRAQLDVLQGFEDLELRVDGACPVDLYTLEPRCSPLDHATSFIVNAGVHEVRLRQPGREPRNLQMDLGPGAVVRLRVAFEVPLEPPRNPWFVPAAIAWAATTGFAVAIGGTTLSLAITPGDDTQRRDALTTLRVVAIAGGGLALGTSIVLTVLAARWRAPSVDVGVAPSGLVLRGSF